ncbi:MAG: hypothetical protein ABIQ59_03640 [Nocardioidaceae bacterium]
MFPDFTCPGPALTVSVVALVPGTANVNHLVVSPGLSNGDITTDTNRKRFYVIVTGDSKDYVAP